MAAIENPYEEALALWIHSNYFTTLAASEPILLSIVNPIVNPNMLVKIPDDERVDIHRMTQGLREYGRGVQEVYKRCRTFVLGNRDRG